MLAVQDLAVVFGAIRAVRGVSLEVRDREIVTLVGANGAGKSSTLNAIAGLVRPAAGEIRLDARPVTGLPAHRLVRLGGRLAPQGRQGFPRFSVEENLAVGAYSPRDAPAGAPGPPRGFPPLPLPP